MNAEEAYLEARFILIKAKLAEGLSSEEIYNLLKIDEVQVRLLVRLAALDNTK